MRCDLAVNEFWQMTPAETFAAIEAYFWRSEIRRKERVSQAWLTAKLIRGKKMPALSALLVDKKARKLSGRELRERRREFKEMTQNIDLSRLK